MGLHKPFDRHFVIEGGSIKETGGSLLLSKGQLGLFDITKTSKDGAESVTVFEGKSKRAKYELKVGTSNIPVTRSQSNKSMSTFPFTLGDVQDLRVSAPNRTEQAVDVVIAGYNGIDDKTSFKFEVGDSKKIVLRLSGEAIGLLGYTNNYVDVAEYMESEPCTTHGKACEGCDECIDVDCLPITQDVIDRLLNHQLRGGVKVSDFVKITLIHKCNITPTIKEVPFKFYELEVCDTGDSSALALVKSQYEHYKIERTNRVGSTSIYQMMVKESEGAPSDYKVTLPSIIKGCKDCPANYNEVKGGIVYAVTLFDKGDDKSDDLKTLPNVVEDSVIKADHEHNGTGYYTVVLTKKLSDEALETFVKKDGILSATVTELGTVKSICKNDTIKTVSWVENGKAKASEQEYVITLPDNECGEGRLEELQGAFPNLVIEEEGTKGGCQTKYKTKVLSNVVYEQCDPIFVDFFRTEAPMSFAGKKWELNEMPIGSDDCKCGIRFEGKVLEVHPSECLREELGFIDTSVHIQVSGGFLTEVRAGDTNVDAPFNVEYLSNFEPRTHLGGNLFDYEERGRVFFTGQPTNETLLARTLKGAESSLESGKQYVDYALTLRRDYYTQSFAGRGEDNITYHFLVEVGRHQGVEDLLNKIALAAGIPTVQAFAK